MPDDVQQRMYRTVPGLENCVIVKNAYAIEYDCINANDLKLSLEMKTVDGVFCAGQFNGCRRKIRSLSKDRKAISAC